MAAREESLMRFMRQQNEQAGRGGGGHPSPDQSPSRRSRISSNTGHVDNYYPREEQRTQPQYHDDHPQQHHGYQRGPAHDALKALQDYNKRMQGEFAPAWQPSASQYGGPDSSSLYPGNGGSGSGGYGFGNNPQASPGRSKRALAHMAACRERAPPVPDYDGRSSNMWASNGSQNTGNFITDRPTTKVVAPPWSLAISARSVKKRCHNRTF